MCMYCSVALSEYAILDNLSNLKSHYMDQGSTVLAIDVLYRSRQVTGLSSALTLPKAM